MSKMLEKLRKHLEETPKEEIDKIWDELGEFSDVGPKAIDLVRSWDNFRGYYYLPFLEILLIGKMGDGNIKGKVIWDKHGFYGKGTI